MLHCADPYVVIAARLVGEIDCLAKEVKNLLGVTHPYIPRYVGMGPQNLLYIYAFALNVVTMSSCLCSIFYMGSTLP